MHWQLYRAHYITNTKKKPRKIRKIPQNLYILASSEILPQQSFGFHFLHSYPLLDHQTGEAQPLRHPGGPEPRGGETATFQFFPGRPAWHLKGRPNDSQRWDFFRKKIRCRCLENGGISYKTIRWNGKSRCQWMWKFIISQFCWMVLKHIKQEKRLW